MVCRASLIQIKETTGKYNYIDVGKGGYGRMKKHKVKIIYCLDLLLKDDVKNKGVMA